MSSLEKVKVKLQLNPSLLEFSWVAGKLFEQGEFDEALTVINRGLEYHQADIVARIVQAKIKFAQDDIEHSKELWSKIAELRPATIVAHKYLMEIALVQNDAEASRICFQNIKQLDPWFLISSENESAVPNRIEDSSELEIEDTSGISNEEASSLDFTDETSYDDVTENESTEGLDSLMEEAALSPAIDPKILDKKIADDFFGDDFTEPSHTILAENESIPSETSGQIEPLVLEELNNEMMDEELDLGLTTENLEIEEPPTVNESDSIAVNKVEEVTELLELGNLQQTFDDLGVDGSSLESALDNVFGELDEDFNFSSDDDLGVITEAPPEPNEQSWLAADEVVEEPIEEIVKLPILDLVDDDDDFYFSEPELAQDTAKSNYELDVDLGGESLAEVSAEPKAELESKIQLESEIVSELKIESNQVEKAEEIITGDDVSDALDEIFGELEDDTFDSSLMSADTNPSLDDIFQDSDKVIEEMVGSKDLIDVPPEGAKVLEVSETEQEVELETEQENTPSSIPDDLSSAVIAELDALFDDDDDLKIVETNIEIEAESAHLFTNNFENKEADELFDNNKRVDDDVFGEENSLGELSDSGTDFYNIEGADALDSEFDLEGVALDDIKISEEIQDSLPEILSLDVSTETKINVTEDQTTPTVTLAEIYFEQELYDRSIEMYQDLIKIEGDNGAYQTRIEEIKKHID